MPRCYFFETLEKFQEIPYFDLAIYVSHRPWALIYDVLWILFSQMSMVCEIVLEIMYAPSARIFSRNFGTSEVKSGGYSSPQPHTPRKPGIPRLFFCGITGIGITGFFGSFFNFGNN